MFSAFVPELIDPFVSDSGASSGRLHGKHVRPLRGRSTTSTSCCGWNRNWTSLRIVQVGLRPVPTTLAGSYPCCFSKSAPDEDTGFQGLGRPGLPLVSSGCSRSRRGAPGPDPVVAGAKGCSRRRFRPSRRSPGRRPSRLRSWGSDDDVVVSVGVVIGVALRRCSPGRRRPRSLVAALRDDRAPAPLACEQRGTVLDAIRGIEHGRRRRRGRVRRHRHEQRVERQRPARTRLQICQPNAEVTVREIGRRPRRVVVAPYGERGGIPRVS